MTLTILPGAAAGQYAAAMGVSLERGVDLGGDVKGKLRSRLPTERRYSVGFRLAADLDVADDYDGGNRKGTVRADALVVGEPTWPAPVRLAPQAPALRIVLR